MIARVFPRKTNLTPDDNLAFYGSPTMFMPDGIKQVHISTTFTYDLERGEKLAKEWESIAPVVVGGVAYGKPSGEFVPGMYVKKGQLLRLAVVLINAGSVPSGSVKAEYENYLLPMAIIFSTTISLRLVKLIFVKSLKCCRDRKSVRFLLVDLKRKYSSRGM